MPSAATLMSPLEALSRTLQVRPQQQQIAAVANSSSGRQQRLRWRRQQQQQQQARMGQGAGCEVITGCWLPTLAATATAACGAL